MIRLEMKNYNMISTGKKQKYLRYHRVKLINMNILYVIYEELIPPYDQSCIIE